MGIGSEFFFFFFAPVTVLRILVEILDEEQEGLPEEVDFLGELKI
jgi:hypothetical protein